MRRLVAYPWLIAIYPILSLYVHNMRETQPHELLAPVALALAATLVIWLTLMGWLKDGHRAGLITALSLVLFYTVARCPPALNQSMFDLSIYWVRNCYPHVRFVHAAAVAIALLGGLSYYIIKRLKSPRSWTPVLNLFGVLLVLLPVSSGLSALASRAPAPTPEMSQQTQTVFPTSARPARRPDIYYIILDGFGRSDVLKRKYDYDLEPFLEALERLGFFVARASTSNYGQTRLSLASSLNATYLDPAINEASDDVTVLRTRIGSSRIVRTLRGLDYRFVTFATGYELTEIRNADDYLTPYSSHFTEFQRLLLGTTPLTELMPDPVERDGFATARERILYILDHLPEVANRSEPTFTFAHILSPHPPFLFGEKGEVVDHGYTQFLLADGDAIRLRTPDEYIQGYRKQVAFLTGRILETVTRILANSPEPPIIILQGDHGPGSGLNMEDPEHSDLQERMSILNAYYLPGVDRSVLYDSITPVNTFRVVLNTYFGAKLELLKDRNYISKWSEPYAFHDITERVRLVGH